MTSISDTEVVNAPGGLVELGRTTGGYVTTNTTSETTGMDMGCSLSIVCDGSPLLVEAWSNYAAAGSGGVLFANVYVDGVTVTNTSRIWRTSRTTNDSIFGQMVIQPSAGIRTIAVRPWHATAAGYVDWAVIRISKIIQASQLLVTQSNAPIVTSLPSGNLVTGQEVDLYVTTPYVGYQRYKWNGSAWYVIGDSRAQGVWQSFTPTLTQSSNINFNINYAKYVMFGKTVMVNFSLSPTSSGVLNNNILLGFGSGSTALPTAASTNGIHGNFRWFDVGVSNWVGTICGSSTTSVFFTNDGNGNNPGFSGTLTNGDVIEGSFFYEMA